MSSCCSLNALAAVYFKGALEKIKNIFNQIFLKNSRYWTTVFRRKLYFVPKLNFADNFFILNQVFET